MRKLSLVKVFLVIPGVLILTFALAACSTPPTPTQVQSPADGTTSPAQSIDYIYGGVLYDHWMHELEVDTPAGDHPLWKTQTTNTREGTDTWRCKECHGWDYKGVDGAYGSGSHLTGFKGLLGATSMSDADRLAWLNGTKNPDHDFSLFFDDDQLNALADFLKEGLSDTASYINADKTINGGDIQRGETRFKEVCSVCHGEDGRTLNFGDEAAPEYVGTIAIDNPWEFWHKVSFGQPDEVQMLSGRRLGWTPQDIADVLTFAQTLPGE
jgi:mono/diheme cytochrome c family protein